MSLYRNTRGWSWRQKAQGSSSRWRSDGRRKNRHGQKIRLNRTEKIVGQGSHYKRKQKLGAAERRKENEAAKNYYRSLGPKTGRKWVLASRGRYCHIFLRPGQPEWWEGEFPGCRADPGPRSPWLSGRRCTCLCCTCPWGGYSMCLFSCIWSSAVSKIIYNKQTFGQNL